MLPDCKITEIFFMGNKFSQNFDNIVLLFPRVENHSTVSSIDFTDSSYLQCA